MEHYTFHEGELPAGFEIGFEETIFNLAAHRHLQAPYGWISFFILHNKLKRARAAIHFYVHDEAAKSHLKSPFGSVIFSSALSPEVLFKFIQYFEGKLSEKGVKRIVIRNYPDCYQPDSAALLSAFLFNLNYKVSGSEVSSFFNVGSNPVEKRFNHSTRYVLEKSRKAGLTFSPLPSLKSNEVYNFICEKQEAKGYGVSMDKAHFEKTISSFPDRYFFFGVYSEHKLVAAAIVVKVNERILYDYIHAHDPVFDHLSPVVFLVTNLYQYALANKFEIFDLGTSAWEGKPDFPLLYFKRSLGAQATLKLTFEKDLD